MLHWPIYVDFYSLVAFRFEKYRIKYTYLVLQTTTTDVLLAVSIAIYKKYNGRTTSRVSIDFGSIPG